jgi:hypothetical protein
MPTQGKLSDVSSDRRSRIQDQDGGLKHAVLLYALGEGTGVAQDEVEARKWFERSAECGYGKAAEQLTQPSH